MLKLIASLHRSTRLITRKPVCRNYTSTKYKNSFNYRILDYFESTLKSQKPSQSIEFSPIYRGTNFGINSNDDNTISDTLELKLQTIHDDIEKLANIKDTEINEDFLDDLDIKCFSIVNALQPVEILKILNSLLKTSPYLVVRSYFYDKAISLLIEYAENGCLSRHEMIQLLYFASLHKDRKVAQCVDYLQIYVPHMTDLPLFEKCISAYVFHKSAIKLKSNQVKVLEKEIEENFDTLVADPDLLVSICKAVMHSEPNDLLTLKNLTKAIAESKKPFSFAIMSHILSLYAEALLMEVEVIDKLVKDSIEMIREDIAEESYSLDLRDIDRFLYSISRLGITLTLNEKMVLRQCVEERFKEYKMLKNLDILINSVLRLHILRCWSTKILKTCLQERLFLPVVQVDYHWKVKTWLQLLVTQIMLEMRMYVPKPLTQVMQIGYVPSESVSIVSEIVKVFQCEGLVMSSKIDCPIRTLVIPGVTLVTEKETYHVDVLDNLTCLRNTKIPHGLMNLKLRLLSRLRYRQILVNGDIFKNNPEEARSMIEHQIRDYINYGKASQLKVKNRLLDKVNV